jgi:tetratricopeptide (TPR) repeat protein
MNGLIPILAVIVALIFAGFLGITVMGRLKRTGSGAGSGAKAGMGKKAKDRNAVLRDADKRLAQNPRDVPALIALGDLYYREEAWDNVLKTYGVLLECALGNKDVNEFEMNLRYGIAALKADHRSEALENEAYKSLTVARALNQNNYEVNLNLGLLEFRRKNYEKAVQVLQQARKADPENPVVLRHLGQSFFKLKRFKEAMTYIRMAIDIAQDDKESLYTLAECYYDANQVDQALKIFSHLRPDPVMGPNACLAAGTINMEHHQDNKAILDFEIGLKHQNIETGVLLELKYRLATLLLKQQEIGKALGYLKDIQGVNSAYKDVPMLIGKYQELNANKNLQIYLMSPSADFVALCRKVVMTFFDKAKTKITNISVTRNDWADILAEVETAKWSDIVMFRFIRTTGSIGELILRDFHAQVKDAKAGKGICVTVGAFSEEAKRFTEARLIDLIEKEKLALILNKVDAAAASP